MSILRKIIRDESIERGDYQNYLSTILTSPFDKLNLVALLSALSAKPIALQDVENFVSFIESSSPKKRLNVPGKLINIVGTGGGIPTFNVSTAACFVAAAAGAKVLKSGSYAYNSRCGSLDLLTSLGFKLNISEKGLESMLNELNLGFVSPAMYAPILRRIAISIHPLSLQEIGGFINRIGPLICPYQVDGQICGVSDYAMLDVFSQALKQQGLGNRIVVWSEIGMDEFSAIGQSHFAQITETLSMEKFIPSDYDMYHIDQRELSGGSPETNKGIITSVLKHGKPSAARDTVIINAAFMLKLGDQTNSLTEAIAMAREVIDNGCAYHLLHNAIEFSCDHALVENLP